ncbi:MAG: hypothetical protein L0I76_19270 [Pseudonocardia sp.]|nr:hypothetical protein [Pseudonocardia sp.]
MSNHEEHSRRWLSALTSGTGQTVALYADNLVYDDHADRDCVLVKLS